MKKKERKQKEEEEKKKKRVVHLGHTASKDQIFPQNVTIKSMAKNICQRNFPVARYLSSNHLKFGFACFLSPLHTQKPQRSIQSKQRPPEKTLVTFNIVTVTDFNVRHLRRKPTAGLLRVYQCTNISSRKSLSKA